MTHTTDAAADVHDDAIRMLREAEAAADACETLADVADALHDIPAEPLIAAAMESIYAAALKMAERAAECERDFVAIEDTARDIYHRAMRERAATPFPKCDTDEAEARVHFFEVGRMHGGVIACVYGARECAEKIKALLENADETA